MSIFETILKSPTRPSNVDQQAEGLPSSHRQVATYYWIWDCSQILAKTFPLLMIHVSIRIHTPLAIRTVASNR